METNNKELYNAPATTVVEVSLDNGVLVTTSNYYKYDYYEE